MAIDKSFLGTGWSFPPKFSKGATAFDYGGRLRMVTEEDDIRESLHILLSTAPGERVMQPAYGCGLKLHVFDNVNESTVTEIKDLIERAILFFEPRISVEKIAVADDEILSGLLKINVEYRVRATNTRSNMVYPFYFLEGTNVSL